MTSRPGSVLRYSICTSAHLIEQENLQKDIEAFDVLRLLLTIAFVVINILAWADKIPAQGLAINNIGLAITFTLASLKLLHLTAQRASAMVHSMKGESSEALAQEWLRRDKIGLMIAVATYLLALAVIITLNVFCLKGRLPLINMGKVATVVVLAVGAYQMLKQKKTLEATIPGYLISS